MVAVALSLLSLVFFHPSVNSYLSSPKIDRFVDQLPFSDHLTRAVDFGPKDHFDKFVFPEYLGSRDGLDVQKYLMPFDPRFTLGLVLNHVSKQIMLSKSVYEVNLPEFHWADYSDLSVLNQYYFSKEKQSCKELFDVTTSSKIRNAKQEFIDPALYCLDASQMDKAINDPATTEKERKALKLAQSRPVSTGWYIYDNGGRSKQSLKILHSKSYLDNFMAPPRNLVLIIPTKKGPASVTVPVNQEVSGRERLSQGSILEEYLTLHRQTTPEPPNVDVGLEVKKLSDLVTKYTKVTSLPFKKILKHEDFVADCPKIVESLNDDVLESVQAYKQSLEMSLTVDQPPKYFKEAKILRKENNWAAGGHYDWRFFSGIINYTDKQPPVLHGLLQAYLKFANANNITTWVAHGSLLSWYWNGVAFPWDNDIDVQMPIQDLHLLSKNFNQSLIVDMGGESGHEIRYGRYFIDCGTFISHRTAGNGHNNIDARFIDVDTGFYIDITGLSLSDEKANIRYNDLLPPHLARNKVDETITELSRNEFLQVYNCRHHHFARLQELSPLSLSMVEGQYTYVPSDYEHLLMYEYGIKGIVNNVYKVFTYVPVLRLWIPTRTLKDFSNENNLGWTEPPLWKNWKAQHYVQFLSEHEDHFIEYVSTRGITQLHQDEMALRKKHRSSEKFVVKNIERDPFLTHLRHDFYSFLVNDNGYDFRIREDEVKKQFEEFDQFLAEQKLKAEAKSELEGKVEEENVEQQEEGKEEGKQTQGQTQDQAQEGGDRDQAQEVQKPSNEDQDQETKPKAPMPKLQTDEDLTDVSMTRPQPEALDPNQPI